MTQNEVKAKLAIRFEKDQAQDLSIPTASNEEDSTLYENLNNEFERRFQPLDILAGDKGALNMAIQEVNQLIDKGEVTIRKESGSTVSNIRLIQ